MGDLPWGAHLCQFFESEQDLAEIVLPFLTAGVEQGERCMWLAFHPLDRERAAAAMRGVQAAGGALQIVDAAEWYAEEMSSGLLGAIDWHALVDDAQRAGFPGIRVVGCHGWQHPDRWDAFLRYEESLDRRTSGLPIIALCAYPLASVGAAGVLNVARAHQMAIARRAGTWTMLETPNVSQLRMRNRQQAAIATLGQSAIRARDPDVVLEEAAALAADTLGTGRCIVWQARHERGDLILRAHSGWDELAPGTTIPVVATTAAAWVLRRDEPVLLADLRNESFAKSWVLRDHGIVTILSASIRGRERPWGLLSVHSQTPRSFTADDTAFLQALANVLALAIERDEHEREERRKHELLQTAFERMHAIERIADGAVGRMGIDDLFAELLARLREALRGDYTAILFVGEDQRHFRFRAVDGFPFERLRSLDVPITTPISAEVLREGRARIFNDLPAPDAPEWNGWPAKVGLQFRSAMGAPLTVEGKIIGTVVVTSTERREFTDDELTLLRMVADRAAPAIERARLVETVRATGRRLEALSRRLLEVQEEERRRLAVELHDQLGQVFTALKIKLDTVARSIAGSTQLNEASGLVAYAVTAVRDLALDLRPAMLDDIGLAAALRWYTDRFAKTYGIQLHLAIDAVPPLDPAVATASFRVAQEALTNVARHSGARNVWLELHASDDTLELIVRDDGSGFDVAAARERAVRGESLGILGMEERVSLASGVLEVASAAGSGTTVQARFPLAHGERA